MACHKKTKNGDLIKWPCGKKEDGHVFEGNFKDKTEVKEKKKAQKNLQKYLKQPKQKSIFESHQQRFDKN